MSAEVERALQQALETEAKALQAAEQALRDSDFARCKRSLGDAAQAVALTRQSLRRADLSLSRMSGPDQAAAHRACESCRERVDADDARVREIRSEIERHTLFGSRGTSGSNVQNSETESSKRSAGDVLQSSMASHERSSGLLQESRSGLRDTEQVHLNVLNDLSGQRETLLRAGDRVRETGTAASQSRAALRRMARNTIYNRALLWAIVFLLVSLIGVLVFIKFIR